MQTSISSTAKRSTFTRCVKKQIAQIAVKKPAKQADLFAPLPDEKGAAQVVTTPAASGQVVGLPINPCLFPQPSFEKPSSLLLLTGYMGASCFELRDDIDSFNKCGLDAPLYLPMGGANSMLISGSTMGFSLVLRA